MGTKLHWGCKFTGIKRCEELRNYYDKVKDCETFLEMPVCSVECADKHTTFCWVTLKFSISLYCKNITEKMSCIQPFFCMNRIDIDHDPFISRNPILYDQILFQKENRSYFYWLLLVVKDRGQITPSNQQKFSRTLFICGRNSICEWKNNEQIFKAK